MVPCQTPQHALYYCDDKWCWVEHPNWHTLRRSLWRVGVHTPHYLTHNIEQRAKYRFDNQRKAAPAPAQCAGWCQCNDKTPLTETDNPLIACLLCCVMSHHHLHHHSSPPLWMCVVGVRVTVYECHPLFGPDSGSIQCGNRCRWRLSRTHIRRSWRTHTPNVILQRSASKKCDNRDFLRFGPE